MSAQEISDLAMLSLGIVAYLFVLRIARDDIEKRDEKFSIKPKRGAFRMGGKRIKSRREM
jgi:hypothetical protein